MNGEIVFANQSFWDLPSMGMKRDKQDKFLGKKTTSLEFAGILIPFLMAPQRMAGKEVLIQVDNIGCVFAWKNGYSKEDNLASILVRFLVLLSAKLSCIVHIHHLPRNSSWESCLADRLSRESSTTASDRMLLRSFHGFQLPSMFRDWMSNPVEDWNFPIRLINDLSNSFLGTN